MMIACSICQHEFTPDYARSKYCSIACRKKRKADTFVAQRRARTAQTGTTKGGVCTECHKPIIADGKCYDCAVETAHIIQPASWRFMDIKSKGFRQYGWLKGGF